MKKTNYSFKTLPIAVGLMLSIGLAGCYQDSLEEMSDSTGVKLKVVTRSVSGSSLQLPLSIYAFDSKGKCRAEKHFEEEVENVSLNLPEGSYRITAVAGSEGFTLPKESNSTATISTQSNNYSSSALSMGHADVHLTGNSSTTIQMALKVASISMSLSDIPEDTQAVSVEISKLHSKIDMEGNLSEAQNTVIECEKDSSIWTTGQFYVLPGASESTVISISLTNDSCTQTYGYTLGSRIKAGTPYRLNGSFSEGFTFNGTIELPDWDEAQEFAFVFGPGVDNSGVTDEPEQENPEVGNMPTAPSIWNGHVVAWVDDMGNGEANMLLISLDEWSGVVSAIADINSEEAQEIAEEHSEADLDGWRIPTKAEAKNIKKTYGGDNLYIINNVLAEAGGGELSVYEEDGKTSVRYLCEDATYTYSLKATNSSITKAGAKTEYHLRLVKTVRVKAKD